MAQAVQARRLPGGCRYNRCSIAARFLAGMATCLTVHLHVRFPRFCRRLAMAVCVCAAATWAAAQSTSTAPEPHTVVERMLRNQQWAQAQAQAQSHLAQYPNDPKMRLLLSRVQMAQGDSDAAQQTLLALTLEFPELPEPHNNLAVLLAAQGRTQEALESLHKAVRQRPDDALALENLGDLYLSLALRAYGRAPSASASGKAQRIAPLLTP